MNDIKMLLPHHRAEPKMERWKTLSILDEIGENRHCNKAILFEGRRKMDLYMFMGNLKEGPTAKFLIENISTMGELKLTGNCLKGARPLLSFDDNFSTVPYLMLIRELLTQTFGVPNYHPKSQPFVDRVYTFTFLDNRIWFRNFQVLSEDGALAEIGPRFVLNPIKIFEGSFSGNPLWENPSYQSPAKYRQALKKKAKYQYLNRIDQKNAKEMTEPMVQHDFDKYEDVFDKDAETVIKREVVDKQKEEKLMQLKKQSKEKNRQAEIRKLREMIKQQKPKDSLWGGSLTKKKLKKTAGWEEEDD
jgi:ribosome biogenesis protein BRX1